MILKTLLGGEGPPVVTSHTVPIMQIEKLKIKTYSDMVLLEGLNNQRQVYSYLIPNIENTLFLQTDKEIEFQHAQIVTGSKEDEDEKVVVDKIEHLGKG
jgi:hypothetical protein